MKDQHIEWIKNSTYDSLSAAQKVELSEVCATKEEFMHLKWVFNSMAKLDEDSKPSESLKMNLNQVFQEKHQARNGFSLNSTFLFLLPKEKKMYQQPLYQMAAVGLLLFGLYFVLNHTPRMAKPAVQMAKNEKIIPSQKMNDTSSFKMEQNQTELSSSSNTFPENDELYLPSIALAEQDEGAEDRMLTASSPSNVAQGILASQSIASDFNHVDGVYKAEEAIQYAYSMGEDEGLFEVLTASF